MSKKRLSKRPAGSGPNPARPPARLPQRSETWAVASAQLRIWITPEDQPPSRPYMLFILDLDHDLMLGGEMFDHDPSAGDVLDVLLQTMARPQARTGGPRRPARVVCADRGLAEALAPGLGAITVTCETRELPMLPAIIADLETHMREGEPEPPGLLSVAGVTPQLAGGFFAAAAECYRAAPWVRLANEQPIGLRISAERGAERFAVVMGNAGMEYGLAVYESWAEFAQLYAGVDDPVEALPAHGSLVMFYESVPQLPFADLDAQEQYGWPVAGEQAYPVPWVFYPDKSPRRPAPDELAWLEAALRAMVVLVRDHLQPGAPGDYQPFDVTVTVATHAGDVAVRARYPAGVLSRERQAAQPEQWEPEDDEDTLALPDRRGMEGALAQIVAQMSGSETPGDPRLQEAQALMYQAWEETNPAKRLARAHQALAISADCADAYVLLAQEEAATVAQALEYYRQGVAAGERALGPEYFTEGRGRFWGLLETRPYMRAREGLAHCLWKVGRREESLEHYRALLDLNENDNQGMRYVLAELLLSLDRDDELLALLGRFPDDAAADWLYTWALAEFRRGGVSDAAERRLREALKWNRHVPAYLLGRKRVPHRQPDYIGMGDEREATAYAGDFLSHWRRTPGAIAWLESRV
jgi:tetratricopeptide (TPR) repeat protein